MANETIKKTQFDSSIVTARTPIRLSATNKAKLFEMIDMRSKGQSVQERISNILSAEDQFRLAQMELVKERAALDRLSDHNRHLQRVAQSAEQSIESYKSQEETMQKENIRMALVGLFAGIAGTSLIHTLF